MNEIKMVQCKNCANLHNHWCRFIIDSPDEDLLRLCGSFVQKTNYHMFVSKTPEELAIWIAERMDCAVCKDSTDGECPCKIGESCYKHFLDWLNAEVRA